MKENRRYRRFLVDSGDMEGNMLFAHAVKIINLSIGGVALTSDRKLNVGCEYTLKFACEDRRLSVKGIVVWSTLTEKMKDVLGNFIPLYAAGMRFTDMSEDKIQLIARFLTDRNADAISKIDIYCSDGDRAHVRVILKIYEEAVLRCHESYKIKKLGLGGMLIESFCPLEVEDQLPMELIFHNNQGNLKFLGRVASCSMTSSKVPAIFELGIEFLGLTQRDVKILNDYIFLIENSDLNSSSIPAE